MPVGSLCLGEWECPIDHRVQTMERDSPVHRLEISAAPNADGTECDAATGQQQGI